MDDTDLLTRLGDRFGASRSEAIGLLVLVACGVLVVLLLWWWQRPGLTTPGQQLSSVPELSGATIVVHVTGEVRTPGVVTTVDGARIVDVIALAGGSTGSADLAALNLARLVIDGEQIIVPTFRTAGRPDHEPAYAGARDAQGRLRINLATAQEFEELPGIGPVLARRIVQHRESHGPFASTGALRAVAGIGEKTFQSLVDLIVA